MVEQIHGPTPDEIEQVRELLSPYLDGEVTDGERALVERVLAGSTDLQAELATLRQTVLLLQSLPRVSTPRPFTLSEVDAGLAPPAPARAAGIPFWRRLGLGPLLGGVAALLVVVVFGAVILSRMGGGVAAPQAVQELAATAPAEAPPAAVASAPTEAVVVEKEVPLEAAEEAEMAAEAQPESLAVEATPVATAAAEAGAAPAEMAEPLGAAEEPAADAASPAPSLPSAAAPPPAERTKMAPSLTVEAQTLEIKPGQIHITGRVALPPGTALRITFWRNDEPFDWAQPRDLKAVVGEAGQIEITLRPRPERTDADLFQSEPADYLLKLESLDPAQPGIAHIYFDTYTPPPANDSTM